MPTLKMWSMRAEYIDQFGEPHVIGQLTTEAPVTLSFTTGYERTFSITSGSTQKIYDATTDIGDFDFALITVNKEYVEIQPTTNAGGASEKFLENTLRKNLVYFIPTDRTRNSSSAVVDTFAGTSDTIEELWLKHTSTGTCVAKIMAGT